MIGQLVKVRMSSKPQNLAGKMGVILDEMEMNTGFSMYEVLIDGQPHWLEDLDIERLHENR